MKPKFLLAGICFQLSLQIFGQNPTSGLVGYWPFNGNVNDSSSSLNHGTIINGATFTNDRFNNAVHAIQLVKSSSQYVTVNHSPSLQISSAISASFWIKRNTLGGQDQVLNKGGDWPSGTCNYGIVFSEWTLVFIYNGGYYIVNSPGVPQDYNWHHYVVTAVHGTTEVHFFVDGVERPSQFGGGNPTVDLYSLSSSDLYIGGVNYFSDNAMDDLRIYNRLLTTSEILSLYSGLIAYLPFNGNVSDESGNGYNGNINGNATLTSDRFLTENKAFTFPDQSSNITLSNTTDINLENGFAINAWVKYKNNNTTAVIVCKHVCGFPNGFFFGIDTDGQIQLWLANSGWSTVRTNTAFVENRWYMMTASYDAGTGIAKIYINGEISGSGNVTYNNFNSNPISIGESYNNNCGPGNLSGAVDEVKIYNRSLSEEEISQEYNLTRSSLVAYYPFNGNANDESGNDINPTYISTGVTLTSDRFGNPDKAYYFDGNEGSYIRIPADALPTTNRTISLWFNVPDVANRPGLIGYGGDGNCGTTLLMGLNSAGSAQFFAQGHCGNNQAGYSYTTVPVNNWYHWVLTIDGNTQKIYVNGELKSTDHTFSGSTVVTGKDLALGVITSINGTAPYIDINIGYLTGKLDDVRIYDTALSDEQVLQLHNSEYSGMVAYYPFNGNANDESGNGNNGTINGVINLTADRFGNADKAYSFSHPGYVSVVNSPLFFADELTISYWYKIASYFGERGVLSGVGGNGGYQQYFAGTTFAYMMGYNFPLSGTPFSSNYIMPDITTTWQHVAVTYQKTGVNSSVTKLYINGELKNTENPQMTIGFPAGETFYIGQNHGGVNFNGELDDIRIFNRLLNQTEIGSLFRENAAVDLEDKFISNIKISPNPTNGDINVDMGSIYKKVQIKIFDLYGRLIKEKEFNDEQRCLLNLSEPSGMYFLIVLYENRKATFKLIIK